MMFLSNLKKMDWLLNGMILLLAVFSLVTIYSIAPNLCWQQLLWFALAFGIIIALAQIDWRPLINYRWIVFGIYFFAILLLILTYFLLPLLEAPGVGWYLAHCIFKQWSLLKLL